MKKLIFTTALICLLVVGCEKHEIERIPAPIGNGIQIDSTLENELHSAKEELLDIMDECSLRQVRRAQIKPAQKLILVRASDPVTQ